MSGKPEIVTVLERLQALVEKLLQEPWDQYDKTLRAACLLLTRQSLASLTKVAKAISRITPEESKAVPGMDWVDDTLDSLQ
jgi:hypothetical protein